MRGHYGTFETATCGVCKETFTKKQPGQKFCDVLCYGWNAQVRGRKRLERIKSIDKALV